MFPSRPALSTLPKHFSDFVMVVVQKSQGGNNNYPKTGGFSIRDYDETFWTSCSGNLVGRTDLEGELPGYTELFYGAPDIAIRWSVAAGRNYRFRFFWWVGKGQFIAVSDKVPKGRKETKQWIELTQDWILYDCLYDQEAMLQGRHCLMKWWWWWERERFDLPAK